MGGARRRKHCRGQRALRRVSNTRVRLEHSPGSATPAVDYDYNPGRTRVAPSVTPALHSPLNACLTLLALWGLIGLAGLLRPTSLIFVGRTLFPLGALCGVALAAVALASLSVAPEHAILVVGLPDLPVHLRRDALSSLFLFLLGAASAGVSVFAAGYFRRGHGTSAGLLCLQYHLFLASMGGLLLADDAYAFMVAWETMASFSPPLRSPCAWSAQATSL